jgi:hypothetical protein
MKQNALVETVVLVAVCLAGAGFAEDNSLPVEIDIECISEGMSMSEALDKLKNRLQEKGLEDKVTYNIASDLLKGLTREGMTVKSALERVLSSVSRSLERANQLQAELEEMRVMLRQTISKRLDDKGTDTEGVPEKVEKAYSVLSKLVEKGVLPETAYNEISKSMFTDNDLDSLTQEENIRGLKDEDTLKRLQSLIKPDSRENKGTKLGIRTVERLVKEGVPIELAIEEVSKKLNNQNSSSEDLGKKLSEIDPAGLGKKRSSSQREKMRARIRSRILNHPGKGKAKGRKKGGKPF